MPASPELLDPIALLADLPLEESGIHQLDPDGVSVRAYPYPYLAALSISNDLDSMLIECFESWHAFVNGRGPTEDGDGLGLEIGDSFWMWTPHNDGLLALHWHYPDDEPRRDSPRVGRIVELGRLGWLDTLHSLGNWRTEPDYRTPNAHRDQAKYALDRLDRLGIKPTSYVNHSGSVSNVGGPWGWYQHSDDPDHPFYCMDLLKEFGLKYFWLDSCINFEKFGDHLQYPSRHHLERAIHQFSWNHWLRRREYDGTVSNLEFPGDSEAHRRLMTSFFNKTLIRVNGRDGKPLLAFKRHRGFDQPIMSTFCNQVTESDLDALEAMRGVAIIYQHFGMSGPRGRSPALSNLKRVSLTSPAFDEHARARLQEIAERFRAGRLWVALQSRILNYLWLRETLRYWVARDEAKWVVVIEEIGCDATGGPRRLEEGDLNGLSFSVPSDAPEIVVAIQGRNATLPVRRAPDLGWPGRDAVYLPWQQLEWPT